MRISDWSSDVCSSDLIEKGAEACGLIPASCQITIEPVGDRGCGVQHGGNLSRVFPGHVEQAEYDRDDRDAEHGQYQRQVQAQSSASLSPPVAALASIVAISGSGDRKRTRLNSSH